MNFFEHQYNAIRRTRWLMVLMGIAVLMLSIMVYFVIVAVHWQVGNSVPGMAELGELADLPEFAGWWQPGLALQVLGGTMALVLGASMIRVLILRRVGGSGVAEMLGGRLVSPQTTDELERRLLNIVEEMSIASGVPIPKVYILEDESAINAFAAGHNTGDAVVAVTRGALEHLSRDELQGVIAHEYSHILNGDMAINIKLMGILFGILVIALVGRFLLRIGAVSRTRGRNNAGPALIALLFAGIALLVIGSMGHFFGRMIQAAVSRQREFLSDASAVQFTRNPGGILGALSKIADLPGRSKLQHARASEASHFYFSNGLSLNASGWLSTHPPLPERIRRIDAAGHKALSEEHAEPSRQVSSRRQVPGAASAAASTERGPLGIPASPMAAGTAAMAAGAASAAMAASAMAPTGSGSTPKQPESRGPADHEQGEHAPGTVEPRDTVIAADMIAGLSEEYLQHAHEPFSACGLLFKLLMASDPRLAQVQVNYLDKHFHPRIAEVIAQLPDLGALDLFQRCVLTEIAGASLRHLSAEQQQRALHMANWLIDSDGQLDLFEVLLAHTMRRHLQSASEHARRRTVHDTALSRECSLILSVLAHAGSSNEAEERKAFENGLDVFRQSNTRLASRITFTPWNQHSLRALGAALDALGDVHPDSAKHIHEACYAVLATSGTMNAAERVLFVSLNHALGIPVPASRLLD